MNLLSLFRKALLISFLTIPVSTFANTGVALVHGTGMQTDALNDYWTWEMVNSIAQGLTESNNLLVINCDFDQYAWDENAAGCLAGQLTDFIELNNIDDLVIITHSNGGNVMRWILSNPTWDSRYPAIIDNIRWVIALAPSSLGTPLADAVINGNSFEQSLGWLLGFASDAVRMQQESNMAFLNENWLLGTSGRPTLPSPFVNLVGSDVESSLFDPDSYCGGYGQSVALEITQAWLDNCSDGFLNCSSQAGVSDLSYIDKNLTIGREPLHHNQSRRPCFGLDVLLRNVL